MRPITFAAYRQIDKTAADLPVVPNLLDYDRARGSFSWAETRRELAGLPGGRELNLAHEVVDRHAAGARANHAAIRWLGKHGRTLTYTFAQLRVYQPLRQRAAQPRRGPGERVYALAGRIPELYVAAPGR
jgi:acetyl-CoA synthetase